MEAVISGLSDEFPNVLRSHKILLTFFCCFIGYLLGLPMCTRVGEFHQLLIILDILLHVTTTHKQIVIQVLFYTELKQIRIIML